MLLTVFNVTYAVKNPSEQPQEHQTQTQTANMSVVCWMSRTVLNLRTVAQYCTSLWHAPFYSPTSALRVGVTGGWPTNEIFRHTFPPHHRHHNFKDTQTRDKTSMRITRWETIRGEGCNSNNTTWKIALSPLASSFIKYFTTRTKRFHCFQCYEPTVRGKLNLQIRHHFNVHFKLYFFVASLDL